MKRLAIAYVGALIAMGLLDGLWLGLVAKGLYQRVLGPHLADKVNLPAALAFYLLYALGLMIFAIKPGLDASSWQIAAVRGTAVGAFAYVTYDLTNLATLRGYTATLAVVDIAWGSIMSGAACALAVIAAAIVSGQRG